MWGTSEPPRGNPRPSGRGGGQSGYEGQFKVHKKWRFRFYDVERLECPRCGGVFNHYYGVSPVGKKSEYIIRVKPRATSAGHKQISHKYTVLPVIVS